MIVSVVAAAVAISVATFGSGSVAALALSAAAIGAGVELFDQAVIENKELNEVNWGKVAVAGLAEGVATAICPVSIFGNTLISSGISFLGNNMVGEKQGLGEFVLNVGIGCFGGVASDLLGKGLSKLPKKVFGMKYTNYSTYQQALRKNGYMFPRAEVKQMMQNDAMFRGIRNDTIDYTFSFIYGTIYAALS